MERPKNSPRGTYDLLPSESAKWQRVENTAKDLLRKAGFREIRTPIFEQTEIFQRAAGETSDIVKKEMYTFNDRSDRSITLRPEGTAGVVRAFLSNGMDRNPKPVKLWYYGPMFRYERSQTGRYRQFTQLGVEVYGSATPEIELEVISLAWDLLQKLEIPNLTLEINSVGDQESRINYQEAMRASLQEHEAEICPDCLNRMKTNPLRALDCKVPEDQALYKAKAPKISAYLNEACVTHQERLLFLLKSLDIPYTVNESLVRGLDYYTKTVFEIKTTDKALGTQNTICAGGRYDDLVKEFGGPQTPAFGWALGMERLTSLIQEDLDEQKLDCFLTFSKENFVQAYKYVLHMREKGYFVDIDYEGKSEKKQFELAAKSSNNTEVFRPNQQPEIQQAFFEQSEQVKDVLYESQNVRVEFNSSIPSIDWTPLGYLSDEEFKLSFNIGMNSYIKKFYELQNLGWFINMSMLNATKKENIEWLEKTFSNLCNPLGQQKMAFILPNDAFGKIAIRLFVFLLYKRQPESNILIKAFNQCEDAVSWLKNEPGIEDKEVKLSINQK